VRPPSPVSRGSMPRLSSLPVPVVMPHHFAGRAGVSCATPPTGRRIAGRGWARGCRVTLCKTRNGKGRPMPDTIRLVDYFYIEIPDKPGEGARVLGTLRDARVNLLAFHAFPKGRRAQLDFVPTDSAAFKAAAKNARWKAVGPK